MSSKHPFPTLTADEAAEMIPDGALVGFSGFTPAGAAKAVPLAIAERAKKLHAAGMPYQIRVMTGASTGVLDEALAQADAISWRAPYQSSKTLGKGINSGKVRFVDMHLSHVAQVLYEGFLGRMDYAVVEATDVTRDGRVYLTSSVGAAPTYLHQAEKVVVEINRYHSPRVSELADVKLLPPPPYRTPIPIHHPLDRIGTPYAFVDPKKIVGVVESDAPDGVKPFNAPDSASRRIAENVVRFLIEELRAGRIPPEFLPLQSGVGNIANAVMESLGGNPDVPPFTMYTEVFQDALVPLMQSRKLLGASTCSLTLSAPMLEHVYENIDEYAPRLVLRPQELSNNPGVIRRLGVISMNTALEVDIYGHANSTHVAGTSMMNGIGGSGDFTRNAYLSIFMCPSVAKKGRISTIVPMCTHVDHNEHSVQIVVTEHGLADLRGLAPEQRANAIIDQCAHPAFRPWLHCYLDGCGPGHIRHDLARCFMLHRNLIDCGAMLPEVLKEFENEEE